MFNTDAFTNTLVFAAVISSTETSIETSEASLGHNLNSLLSAFKECDAETERPSVIFAYTVKGWGLPIAGDPRNHSALLSEAQINAIPPSCSDLGLPNNTDQEEESCYDNAAWIEEDFFPRNYEISSSWVVDEGTTYSTNCN